MYFRKQKLNFDITDSGDRKKIENLQKFLKNQMIYTINLVISILLLPSFEFH